MSPRSHSTSFSNLFRRLSWLLLIMAGLISLFCQKGHSYGLPRPALFGESEPKEDAMITGGEKSKRDTTSSSGMGFNRTMPERKQRFCLNRLRDALQLVCSSGSSNRTPLYFNPNQYISNLNGSTSTATFATAGRAKNLRNDIPTIARPHNRRILRRRSRRNIVRECCEKPCSYSSMKKYCSPSVRTSGTHDSTGFGSNQPGYGISPTRQSQQCVSVADLQSYYLKFFRKQWKKDDYNQGQVQEPESALSAHDNNNNNDDNSFITDFLAKTQRKQSKEPTNPSSSASAESSEEEPRNVNEIDETERRIDQSGNLMTAPPITFMISLPRGTNDYMY